MKHDAFALGLVFHRNFGGFRLKHSIRFMAPILLSDFIVFIGFMHLYEHDRADARSAYKPKRFPSNGRCGACYGDIQLRSETF
jgi:hypothetical protein